MFSICPTQMQFSNALILCDGLLSLSQVFHLPISYVALN